MGMRLVLKPSIARRVSSLGVISVAFLLALGSIVGVTSLQHRASSSRDAQVELGQVKGDLDALQSLPFDVLGAKTPAGRSRVLGQMAAVESRIDSTLAGLHSDARTPHLAAIAAPSKANRALLRQIYALLVDGRDDEADALRPASNRFEQQVDRQLELAAVSYRGRAENALRQATYGSAAMILALVSLFGVFYFRERTSHATAGRLQQQNAQLLLHDSQLQVIQRLATAAEYRDDDTGQHTRRVGRLSALIGAELSMPEDQLALLEQAASLHDVGKIGIPDSILLKRGRLTREQFERMKAHTTLGAGMLAGRNFPLLAMAEEIALSHHERWNGTGYPSGISGSAIPQVGRIVAVADVFDALTHARPYKDAWNALDAVAEISSQRGRQFDPGVVKAFLRVLPQVLLDLDAEPVVTSAPRLGVVHAA
jgi:HD-GYP domain-containing protein (c-di-GMP phosphodiesterase class II)